MPLRRVARGREHTYVAEAPVWSAKAEYVTALNARISGIICRPNIGKKQIQLCKIKMQRVLTNRVAAW